MGANSKIEWTHHTFNGWIGCAHATVGDDDDELCRNCYAEVGTMARVQRSRGLPLWGKDAHRHRTSADYWKQPERWNREAAAAGERRRVFSNSLSDIFEDRRDLDGLRADLFALVERTPHLDWLLLTKRPEQMVRLAPTHWRRRWPDNAWAGTSAGTQQTAELRVPLILEVPAAVRFLSMEPLLERVDLDLPRCETHGRDEVQTDDETGEFCNECAASGYSGELSLGHWLDPCADIDQPGINWVIVGGESGPNARPCALEWIESIVRQCKAAGTAAFVKQLGACVVSEFRTAPAEFMREVTHMTEEDIRRMTAPSGEVWAWRARTKSRKGADMEEWPEELQIRQWPEVSNG